MTPVYPRVITWARGLAVASFVALAALVYIRYVQAIAQLGALTNVQTVATNARAVESLLVDAESGVRGYVITADDTYLEAYRRATAQLPPVLATLRRSTSPDASQQEALTAFNAAVKRELDTLRQTIESRRSEGFEAARDIVAAGTGPAALSDLRAATDRILSGARNRVIQARAADFESTRVTRYLMLFLFVFAVGLLLVAGFGMGRELRRRARVEQQLQEAYDEVEDRVRRRTQELIDNHRRLVESEGRAQELAMVRSDLLQREQAARADAEMANRLKDEFLATVSHELRTPLNAIVGWTHLLRNGLAESHPAAIAAIERNAFAQARLINDLLDVSRIMKGRFSLAVTPMDLGASLRAALETVRPAADAKRLQIEVLGAEPVPVLGDEVRLQQMAWNLLSNAVKFTPRDGRIVVEAARVGSRARLRVTDTGEGIAPEFLPHVFEPFRQAAVTRRTGGLGLGLAIVRQIVELHGGTVTAASEGRNRGTSFTIMLPYHDAAADVIRGNEAMGQ